MKKILLVSLVLVLVLALIVGGLAYAATNNFPVHLERGEYLYYRATTTLPDTNWRAHWEPVIPSYRNRVYFEVDDGTNWVLEWTIDLVSGVCSAETGTLPITCWDGPNSVIFDTAGDKIFQRVVSPIYLPLVLK